MEKKDFMHEDMLLNMFIRLPAKQLARMRTLSKPWNALLSQPSFIRSHLDRSIHNNDEVLLVFNHGFRFSTKPFTAHPTRPPHIQRMNLVKLPSNTPPAECYVIGSVNGLICFIHESKCFLPRSKPIMVIYIWNPSLSALLPVPPYTILANDVNDMHLRFGIDPKTNDYKVVKLTKTGIFEWSLVEVYSLRKGCWELINERFPSQVTKIFIQSELCVDGHDGRVHWLCSKKVNNHGQLMIVAFDLCVKTFCDISLPREIFSPRSIQNRISHLLIFLGVLDGKLCVMTDSKNGEFQLWVMNEYGVVESWAKQHVFSQFSGRSIDPFGFTSKNEFLYEVFRNRLALYDPVADTLKFIDRLRATPITKVIHYVDSLVWVTPTKSGSDADC